MPGVLLAATRVRQVRPQQRLAAGQPHFAHALGGRALDQQAQDLDAGLLYRRLGIRGGIGAAVDAAQVAAPGYGKAQVVWSWRRHVVKNRSLVQAGTCRRPSG